MVEIAFRKVNDLALDPGDGVSLLIGVLLQQKELENLVIYDEGAAFAPLVKPVGPRG